MSSMYLQKRESFLHKIWLDVYKDSSF